MKASYTCINIYGHTVSGHFYHILGYGLWDLKIVEFRILCSDNTTSIYRIADAVYYLLFSTCLNSSSNCSSVRNTVGRFYLYYLQNIVTCIVTIQLLLPVRSMGSSQQDMKYIDDNRFNWVNFSHGFYRLSTFYTTSAIRYWFDIQNINQVVFLSGQARVNVFIY